MLRFITIARVNHSPTDACGIQSGTERAVNLDKSNNVRQQQQQQQQQSINQSNR